jgi:carboxypeptidase C (cathepsin A)
MVSIFSLPVVLLTTVLLTLVSFSGGARIPSKPQPPHPSSSSTGSTTRNLTPLLKNGYSVEEIMAISKVNLPGMNTSYAGYFVVNSTDNANAFFWYEPAANGNTNAPIIAWFQGGPGGASSFGQFTELGKFY